MHFTCLYNSSWEIFVPCTVSPSTLSKYANLGSLSHLDMIPNFVCTRASISPYLFCQAFANSYHEFNDSECKYTSALSSNSAVMISCNLEKRTLSRSPEPLKCSMSSLRTIDNLRETGVYLNPYSNPDLKIPGWVSKVDLT